MHFIIYKKEKLMKKNAHLLLFIFFAHSCKAQLIDLRSALSFFSESKLAVALCVIGVGGILTSQLLDSKRKAAKAKIDGFQKRNETKIGVCLAGIESKKIQQSNFSTDDYDAMKRKCDLKAKEIANSIGKKEYPFTPKSSESVQDLSTSFYTFRAIPGTINYTDKTISIFKIESEERFAWLRKATCVVGGLSLVTAGVLGASKLAASKK